MALKLLITRRQYAVGMAIGLTTSVVGANLVHRLYSPDLSLPPLAPGEYASLTTRVEAELDASPLDYYTRQGVEPPAAAAEAIASQQKPKPAAAAASTTSTTR